MPRPDALSRYFNRPAWRSRLADFPSHFAGVFSSSNNPAQALTLGLECCVLIVLTYILPGLIGHDPWKQDETYVFGIVQQMLERGDWIVPTVAGEPFMEKPPLFYWTASALAWLTSPWLALHDGARLATGWFMALTCAALGWSARTCWGARHGRLAVFCLLGCAGMVLNAHMMLTDMPLMTGFALALCGFAVLRERTVLGGVLLGTGVGVGFLAKGMIAPGVLGLTALLLMLCFRNWRLPTVYRALLIAALTALPWLVIWPALLYWRAPALFVEWFWLNNVGRFFGFSVAVLGSAHRPHFWLRTMPWFAFPAVPLALLTIWRERRRVLIEPHFQFCGVLVAVTSAVLWLSASARAIYALPLLLPLSLLAAPAAASLPALVDRISDYCARLVFGLFALLVLTIWSVMMLHGAPPDWAWLTRHLPLDYEPVFEAPKVLLALVMCGVAAALLPIVATLRSRAISSWVIGMTLGWLLLTALLMPWFDAAKSYRQTLVALGAALPSQYRCIASAGLGESERAMLHYVLGIDTRRREIADASECDVLLINGAAEAPPTDIGWRWSEIWNGARPGDLQERFWLFMAR